MPCNFNYSAAGNPHSLLWWTGLPQKAAVVLFAPWHPASPSGLDYHSKPSSPHCLTEMETEKDKCSVSYSMDTALMPYCLSQEPEFWWNDPREDGWLCVGCWVIHEANNITTTPSSRVEWMYAPPASVACPLLFLYPRWPVTSLGRWTARFQQRWWSL